jgi:hypothetical protein
VRFLLAVMTVGIGGAAYVYLHQSDVPKSEEPVAGLRPLFDWDAADHAVPRTDEIVTSSVDPAPLVIRDVDRTTPVEPVSALDEFVRANAEPASKPAETSSATEIVCEPPVAQAGSANSDVKPVSDGTVPVPLRDPAAAERPVQEPRVQNSPAQDSAVEDIVVADAQSATNASQDNVENVENPAVDRSTAAAQSPPATTRRPSVSEATLITSQPTAGENRSNEIVETAAKKPLPAATLAGEKLPRVTSTPVPKPNSAGLTFDSGWKIRSKSINGLPMHTRRFGDQGTRTLIIAGIDGQDRIGVRWIDGLANAIPGHSELFPANEILVFRAGNPDGLIRQTPANTRGVLINRNFPSRRYQYLPDRSAGVGPASETETHAILDALYAFRPRRVIHLAATTGKTKVLYNRSARDVADELQRSHQLDVSPLDVERFPGSIEDFADGTLDAAVISMQLGIGADWQQAWPKHLPAVLTAINGGSFDRSDEDAVASPDGNSTRIPISIRETPEPKKIHRGYEELPPPPN